MFCATRNVFRFGSLAFRQEQTGKSNTRLRTLLINANRLLELLLRFRVFAAGLVIRAKKNSGLHCRGIEFDYSVQAGFRSVRLLVLGPAGGPSSNETATAGVERDRLLHLGDGAPEIASCSQQTRIHRVDFGIVWPLFQKRVDLILGFQEVVGRISRSAISARTA